MRPAQIAHMFAGVPHDLFRVHNWRTDVETLGEVPAAFIREQSEGKLDLPLARAGQQAHLARRLRSHPLHRPGRAARSHRHGQLHQEHSDRHRRPRRHQPQPLPRRGLRHGAHHGPRGKPRPQRAQLRLRPLPAPSAHRLRAHRRRPQSTGGLAVRGLFIGDDIECFQRAAELSLKVNFEIVDEPIRKAVVYLDPSEFHSTWLGNKAVYRTRMALADGAELIILAPGVKSSAKTRASTRSSASTATAARPPRSRPSRKTPISPPTSAPPRTLFTPHPKAASPSPGAPATSPAKRSKASASATATSPT